MKNVWHTAWDSARGPMKRLAPQTRIVCGVSAAAVCLIAPATHAAGIAIAAVILSMWTLLTRPPLRVARTTLLLALVLFLPYFLLTPLIVFESAADWRAALAAPWAVFFHATTVMTVSAFTVTTLSMSALRQGLERLPTPDIINAVLIQIVHQTINLHYETRRMAQAIAVRGGTDGYRTAFRIIFSLPVVWLPRMVDRAERIADAMTLRGYCQRDISPSGSVATSLKDALAISVSLGCIGGAVAVRLWSAS